MSYTATYTAIQVSATAVETDVDLNGLTVKAQVPSLVVQLQPDTLQSDNSVIKLVFPGQTEQAPFVQGAQVTVTFEGV